MLRSSSSMLLKMLRAITPPSSRTFRACSDCASVASRFSHRVLGACPYGLCECTRLRPGRPSWLLSWPWDLNLDGSALKSTGCLRARDERGGSADVIKRSGEAFERYSSRCESDPLRLGGRVRAHDYDKHKAVSLPRSTHHTTSSQETGHLPLRCYLLRSPTCTSPSRAGVFDASRCTHTVTNTHKSQRARRSKQSLKQVQVTGAGGRY